MRCISPSTWAEIRTAYASGLGLRQLARNMNIPAGTVLARSKREGWTQQIATAKLIERPELARELAKSDAINAITPMQSAALTMHRRAVRHVERMAGITDKVLPHLEKMDPAEILDSARNLERFDYVARRNYRLENLPADTGPLTLSLLANHSAVQISIKPD
jgi:hypothetical protein